MFGFVLPDYQSIRLISSDAKWAAVISSEIFERLEIGSDFAAKVADRASRLQEAEISIVRLALDGNYPSTDLQGEARELFYDFLPWVGPHPDSEWFGHPCYEEQLPSCL